MKKSFFLLYIFIYLNLYGYCCANYGINIGQSMNNAGSSYYPNNMVTPVFFQGAIKQADLDLSAPNGYMYKISQPGRYYIASDLSFTPTTTNPGIIGIEIASSNVILDLNTKNLKHSKGAFTTLSGTVSFHLIKIDSSISNITINNGSLTSDNTTLATGIYIDKVSDGRGGAYTANYVNLSNLIISGFNNGGIRDDSTLGNAYGLIISDIYIKTILGDSSTNPYGISIAYRYNITIQNSTINQLINGQDSRSIYGISLKNSNNIKVSNCEVSNGLGYQNNIGFLISDCQNCSFINCSSTMINTTSPQSITNGFKISNCYDVILDSCVCKNCTGRRISGYLLSNNSNGIVLKSCRAASISSSTLDCYGFQNSGNNGIEFIDCKAINNYIGTSTGNLKIAGFGNDSSTKNSTYKRCKAKNNYISTGTGNNIVVGFYSDACSNNTYEECSAIGNFSLVDTSTAAGFYFKGEANSIIKNCIANYNGVDTGLANGLGAGILFDTSLNPCSNCSVEGNQLRNNYGVQQYGFADWNFSSYSTILLKNLSIGHGGISDALSSNGKAIVDSLGTAYKHNYLVGFSSELISSSIKETYRENTDTLSTTDSYNNISIY